MNPPPVYHKALVALHWLLAVLLAVALIMGSTQLVSIPNSSPDKIFALRAHMIAGSLILLLTVVRLLVRLNTAKPAPASTGNPLLDRLGRLTHVLLYLLVFAMAGSGIAMAIQANLPAAVFKLSAALPGSFEHLAPRQAHGYIAKALIALIVLHIAAALYHQFVRKDGLLRRMSWRKDG
ncbi:MAG: cytochrome b/b6 domain-containing protein [Burkholderiales bacterium]|nr:cytochrome b/b6 domain-containing protein [Burkholderiales bacterium]